MPVTDDDDRLMKGQAVADYLQLSLRELQRLQQRGEGPPAIRIGTRGIRYRKSVVDAWISEQPQVTT